MKHFVLTFLLTLIFFSSFAQNHYSRFKEVDIQHYVFEIHLNDSTNRIEGVATVDAKILQPKQKITLDLVGTNDSTNTGMSVSEVVLNGNELPFTQINDQLEITFPSIIQKNKTLTFTIVYSGIPADGLIISKNKYGDRTFFGDNWPNRARFWLPTVDHPSDKATLEFRVVAPKQYQVVSNGVQLEENIMQNNLKITRWKENIPISTKVMVIGVARFAKNFNGDYFGTPVTTWVFPQNKEAGFNDYAAGMRPLAYYSNLIAPYPYEKLANVQSKTRYGGMENAGCIFYAENSVTGKGRVERLMAHEIAHQWFGNSVTEQNWHHVWLSEGFATYLTHLYVRQYRGAEMFNLGLVKDRERIIKYAHKKLAPIIDTSITDYNLLLNTNTYQKASWFLHMLNEKTSDADFKVILQEYYQIFKDSTAMTADFRKVAETISGQDLEVFFKEWLYQPGHPKIKVKWRQRGGNKLILRIKQMQPNHLFTFPLEIKFHCKNGDSHLKTIEVNEWKHKLNLDLECKIDSIQLDPNVKLLFEEFN